MEKFPKEWRKIRSNKNRRRKFEAIQREAQKRHKQIRTHKMGWCNCGRV